MVFGVPERDPRDHALDRTPFARAFGYNGIFHGLTRREQTVPKLERPEGHHTITPAFMVVGAAKVLAFLQQAFGGKVVARYEGPGGVIAHAEVMIGDSVVMLGEAMPAHGHEAMPAPFSYYVDDANAVDETYRRALAAGAVSVTEPADRFYGYRSAIVRDMGGNRWTICAVIEKLDPQEIQRRMQKMMQGG